MNIQHTLDEVVQRIVETAHPRQIILFGSAARGSTEPNSDLDVLEVVAEDIHQRQLAQAIYRCSVPSRASVT